MAQVPLPPRDLGRFSLRTVQVLPSKLYRISRHGVGEPYFGKSAANRLDRRYV